MNTLIKNTMPDSDRYLNRFEIKSKSSGRTYTVAQSKHSGQWSCSCPGWIHHRHCRHLKELTPALIGKAA